MLPKGVTFKKTAESVGGGKYKSSGGGGSNKTKKKTDVVDRYKEINDQISEQQNLLTKNSSIGETLWGKARLDNMEKAISLMEYENKLLKDKINFGR
jgi:hypothetical protein